MARAVNLIFFLILICSQAHGDVARPFGLEAGVSFPKVLFGEAQYSFADDWAVDYQFSIGFFWSVQELDGLYFFKRSDWSPYIGLGGEAWNFFGFTSENLSGIAFTGSSQATSIVAPLGLLYVSDNGFALDMSVGLSVFVSAPSELNGKIIPEGRLALGYFF